MDGLRSHFTMCLITVDSDIMMFMKGAKVIHIQYSKYHCCLLLGYYASVPHFVSC